MRCSHAKSYKGSMINLILIMIFVTLIDKDRIRAKSRLLKKGQNE